MGGRQSDSRRTGVVVTEVLRKGGVGHNPPPKTPRPPAKPPAVSQGKK
jgi:hypothetical protein